MQNSRNELLVNHDLLDTKKLKPEVFIRFHRYKITVSGYYESF